MNITRTHVRAIRGGVMALSLAGLALVAGGCNNAGEGALSGAAVGAGAGAILGSLSGNAGTGAAIGAVAGGVSGGVLGDQNQRRNETYYGPRRSW